MRVLVKLYNMVDPAADGSTIPRSSTEEYLKSADYQTIIKDRVALCGFTHKDRVLKSEYKNIVGPDDQVLINGNYVGYIDKIFLKEPDDKYCYAFITIFDPEDFSGEVRDNIINFRGLMNSKVKLPSSVVIQAMWSPSGRAERIIRIKGLDFTQNPSFKGSGTVKTMSVTESKTEDDTKMFSMMNVPEGFNITTRTFSFENAEIEILSSENPTQKVFSRDQIISIYGLNSDIAKRTKSFAIVTEDQLKKITDDLKSDNRQKLIEKANNLIQDLIRDGEKDVLAQLFTNNEDSIYTIMISVPETDPNYDLLIKPKLVQFFNNLPKVRVFSTVRSIQDRLLSTKYPKFSLIKRLLDNYKFYYEVNGQNMSNDDLTALSAMVKEDIKFLITLVSDKIYKGENLSQLYQLIRFGNEINQSGIELSKIYRRLMISEKVMGFIPQGIYETWTKCLTEFYSSINKYIFGPNFPLVVNAIDKI